MGSTLLSERPRAPELQRKKASLLPSHHARVPDSSCMASTILPFVGPSDALESFMEHLERAAESHATVLLQGESGSGKGRAAYALHALGSRSEAPFVAADLAAIAPSLVESALFGHERGAFTDAHRKRRGLFEKAHGGSLVLDDVDLLPAEVQRKLLRVLQEREVEPLGAEAALPVDVRVIATTNRALADEVAAGRFREDLFYRLAVVTLEVPPLRARVEDIVPVAQGLIERVAERAGVAPRTLSEEAADALREHSWPGNVRELENALERALVLRGPGNTDAIAAEELAFLEEVAHGVADEVAGRALSHGLTVDAVTQAMMERALAEQRGNVSAAARQVGLTRRAFDYRMARGQEEEAG